MSCDSEKLWMEFIENEPTQTELAQVAKSKDVPQKLRERAAELLAKSGTIWEKQYVEVRVDQVRRAFEDFHKRASAKANIMEKMCFCTA